MRSALFKFLRSSLGTFESLQERIYSEVATFISKNEDKPRYLIELFQELQRLTSDSLRRQAVLAFDNIVSGYLTDDSVSLQRASDAGKVGSI